MGLKVLAVFFSKRDWAAGSEVESSKELFGAR